MVNKEDILKKASKCSTCITKPCQVGCPLNNDTTEFIRLAKLEEFEKAYEVLSKTTVLSSVCGRICPHEKQCQGSCAMKNYYGAVEIGTIQPEGKQKMPAKAYMNSNKFVLGDVIET